MPPVPKSLAHIPAPRQVLLLGNTLHVMRDHYALYRHCREGFGDVYRIGFDARGAHEKANISVDGSAIVRASTAKIDIYTRPQNLIQPALRVFGDGKVRSHYVAVQQGFLPFRRMDRAIKPRDQTPEQRQQHCRSLQLKGVHRKTKAGENWGTRFD